MIAVNRPAANATLTSSSARTRVSPPPYTFSSRVATTASC